MIEPGIFGYIIGKKQHMMYVEDNADLLWQVLVREIFVLINHYGTKDALKEAFDNIKIAKNKPKKKDIEKCKPFTDFEIHNNNNNNNNGTPEWTTLLKLCKLSFINILEAGYILNHNCDKSSNPNLVFILDFNKGIARYYRKNWNNKIIELNSATLEEIICFDEMPTMTYQEIVEEMNEKFDKYYDAYLKVEEEIEKLNKLKQESRKQGAVNIEEKVDKLIEDMKWQKKELTMSRRVFYNRLKQLDLIEETADEL
jgi:hypothetical protein